MAPVPTTPAARARARRRRLVWAGLVVVSWAITLGPIMHAVLHDRPHRHAADGSILPADDDGLDEHAPHVHADGSLHGAPSVPEGTPGWDDRGLDGRGAPAPRDVPAPRGSHGAGSLAHFGVALLSAPPPLLPLRPIAAMALPRVEPASVHVPRLAATPIQPRAPPVG